MMSCSLARIETVRVSTASSWILGFGHKTVHLLVSTLTSKVSTMASPTGATRMAPIAWSAWESNTIQTSMPQDVYHGVVLMDGLSRAKLDPLQLCQSGVPKSRHGTTHGTTCVPDICVGVEHSRPLFICWHCTIHRPPQTGCSYRTVQHTFHHVAS